MTIPTIMTKEGLQPQTAIVLRSLLLADVASTNPGYTANLPGSLIEDISSTDVAALAICDSARVELINSLTPYGANAFLLNQLGQIYGVKLGLPTNTSVYVVFTGVPGFIVVKGFTVSDGTHQYTVQDGGIIASDGTLTLFCVATVSGSWAVPANTVNQLVSSVPGSIGLSANNPNPGTAGAEQETEENYRSRVLQAGIAASQGMASFLRTLLSNVAGVQTRLIDIQKGSGTWRILVGGGDPYSVAYAIFTALFDISTLTGSAISSGRNITVTINDYPDYYDITFVNPPAQDIALNITWNTTATNFISDDSVVELASNALMDYINSLYVGFAVNIFEMQTIFQESIASIVPAQFISRLIFNVYINGLLVPPISGTGLVEGDPEGYFQTTQPQIIITRG